jgi:prepilin-type N-terminal cleavage/methylation domain-containing protein
MLESMMTSGSRSERSGGFTLIELMVGVAIIAIIVSLAAPSFKRMIEMQRLRGIHDQLVTDLQFARTEAIRLRTPVHIDLHPATGTSAACYSIFSDTDLVPPFPATCNCTEPSATRCSGGTTAEIKSVQLEAYTGVSFTLISPARFGFDPVNGSALLSEDDFGDVTGGPYDVNVLLDSDRVLKVKVNRGGLVQGCAPSGSKVTAVAC